jgi:hypothetical protein
MMYLLLIKPLWALFGLDICISVGWGGTHLLLAVGLLCLLCLRQSDSFCIAVSFLEFRLTRSAQLR